MSAEGSTTRMRTALLESSPGKPKAHRSVPSSRTHHSGSKSSDHHYGTEIIDIPSTDDEALGCVSGTT
jgi:hypothetical protein